MNIMVVGCRGTMGKILCDTLHKNEDLSLSVGICRHQQPYLPFPTYGNFFDIREPVDVIIDFSHPSLLGDMVSFAKYKQIPLVICTTGYTNQDIELIEQASQSIPIFLSSNMSLGINITLTISKLLARFLGDSFDIEIIEKHHNQKLDAPSGTALLLADNMNEELAYQKVYNYNRSVGREKRKKEEIGIHSIRCGTVVGDHEVIFAGEDEWISIHHSANSKSIFVQGAIKAAKYIATKKKGLYSMDSMVGEI